MKLLSHNAPHFSFAIRKQLSFNEIIQQDQKTYQQIARELDLEVEGIFSVTAPGTIKQNQLITETSFQSDDDLMISIINEIDYKRFASIITTHDLHTFLTFIKQFQYYPRQQKLDCIKFFESLPSNTSIASGLKPPYVKHFLLFFESGSIDSLIELSKLDDRTQPFIQGFLEDKQFKIDLKVAIFLLSLQKPSTRLFDRQIDINSQGLMTALAAQPAINSRTLKILVAKLIHKNDVEFISQPLQVSQLLSGDPYADTVIVLLSMQSDDIMQRVQALQNLPITKICNTCGKSYFSHCLRCNGSTRILCYAPDIYLKLQKICGLKLHEEADYFSTCQQSLHLKLRESDQEIVAPLMMQQYFREQCIAEKLSQHVAEQFLSLNVANKKIAIGFLVQQQQSIVLMFANDDSVQVQDTIFKNLQQLRSQYVSLDHLFAFLVTIAQNQPLSDRINLSSDFIVRILQETDHLLQNDIQQLAIQVLNQAVVSGYQLPVIVEELMSRDDAIALVQRLFEGLSVDVPLTAMKFLLAELIQQITHRPQSLEHELNVALVIQIELLLFRNFQNNKLLERSISQHFQQLKKFNNFYTATTIHNLSLPLFIPEAVSILLNSTDQLSLETLKSFLTIDSPLVLYRTCKQIKVLDAQFAEHLETKSRKWLSIATGSDLILVKAVMAGVTGEYESDLPFIAISKLSINATQTELALVKNEPDAPAAVCEIIDRSLREIDKSTAQTYNKAMTDIAAFSRLAFASLAKSDSYLLMCVKLVANGFLLPSQAVVAAICDMFDNPFSVIGAQLLKGCIKRFGVRLCAAQLKLALGQLKVKRPSLPSVQLMFSLLSETAKSFSVLTKQFVAAVQQDRAFTLKAVLFLPFPSEAAVSEMVGLLEELGEGQFAQKLLQLRGRRILCVEEVQAAEKELEGDGTKM